MKGALSKEGRGFFGNTHKSFQPYVKVWETSAKKVQTFLKRERE